jgi:molybdate transport system substrate-binding protein
MVLAGVAVLAATACAADAAGPAATSAAGDGPVVVFAAASLTEAFTTIADDFQRRTGRTVTLSFGSSATLATQITAGAPADVFAAASPATMKAVTDAGGADPPVDFVSNTLQIAVPRGNPGRVTGLADFADADRTIALCAPQVPCGAAAATVFRAAGITPRPDTLEQDVKAALAKVAADEVDAALVYRTDVIAATDTVEGIEFPESAQAVNRYPIAVLTRSARPQAAQAFVDHVRSPEGQAVLTKAGFARP